jgi:flavin reductase (DIM6/NTAB) family NADH-FMN oxidoreductase RutF
LTAAPMYPFQRFTEDAKRVLLTAQKEAETSGQSYIGTEHILIALLLVPGKARDTLKSVGIEAEQVRERIRQVLGHSQRMIIQQLIPTSRVKHVIELAFAEAQRLDSDTVGTEHLLLGLMLEGESIGAKVLEDLGASTARVIAELGLTDAAIEGTPNFIEPQRFREVMSSFPSGVVIVTAFDHDGEPRGLTVNAFCAVSLEPPLALACIDKLSNTLPAVRHTNGFTANILSAGREPLARLMATKSRDKFKALEWRRAEAGGGPILEHDIAAYAVCNLRDAIEAGDHWILIGSVVDGARLDGVNPLIYSRRDYFDL